MQLYNLETDIREEHDVAAQHPDIVKRFERLMKEARNGPDYIVLNSVSNVGKAIPVLKEYKSALCLLDNDSAGRQAFQQMAQAGCPVRDKSDCYREYNDLNDYLLGRKMAQENKTDHQHETAPKLIEKPAKKQSG